MGRVDGWQMRLLVCPSVALLQLRIRPIVSPPLEFTLERVSLRSTLKRELQSQVNRQARFSDLPDHWAPENSGDVPRAST